MLEPLIPIAKGQKAPPLIDKWQSRPWGELAEAIKKSNGSNMALRLDNYLALDPDDAEAGKILDDMEQEGKLPPTIAWKTWRGRIVRLFHAPPKKLLSEPIKPSGAPHLELRLGSGQYVIIPDSVVIDADQKKTGQYQWLPGQAPDEIDPAWLPDHVLHELVRIAKSGTAAAMPRSADRASISFEQGGRDNTLYGIALTLRKGGMGRADVEKTILSLAAQCDPPLPEREALKKVESAFKETPRERNLTAEIRGWIDLSTGYFTGSEIDRDLGITSKQDKINRKVVLHRFCEQGFIKKVSGRNNTFAKTETDLQIIDPFTANPDNYFHVRWPFSLENYVRIYPKNIIVLAGSKSAGKTAFCMNTAVYNCFKHEVVYFTSEMGGEELARRIELFQCSQETWRKIKFVSRSQNFTDVIHPNAINIVDFLEISDNFWQIASEIRNIYDKLDKGIAILAIQKKAGADAAHGGSFSMEKARLYLNMDKGELTIKDAKNYADPTVNPNGWKFYFKLAGGCKFMVTQSVMS